MDLYFERYDGTAATVEQFIGCFAEVSGRDLDLFMRWYSQAGTPKLTVRTAYDAEAQTYRLDVAQSLGPTPGQPTKLPMTMPLALGLVDPHGGDIALASDDATPASSPTGVFELKDGERSIVFRDVPRRPTLSFLRGFSAPVKVDDDLTEDDLIVLSRHDTRQFQPLAGAAKSRDARAAARRQGDPRRQGAGAQCRPRSPPSAASSRTRAQAASTRPSRRWR